MSEELATTGQHLIVLPGTGEVVDLEDILQVARALAAVRVFKARLDEARGVLEAVLVEEATRRGTKTLRLGDVTAEVGADTTTGWDVERLRAGLFRAGLPADRLNELIEETVEYKVDGRIARQIAGANPAYAKVIERCKTKVPKKPYVAVK